MFLGSGDRQATATPLRPISPRRAFWALLLGALVLSLALPVCTLWRASASGLAARSCMWPEDPRAGTPAQALVVVPSQAAKAIQSRGSPSLQVVLTMPDMAMRSDTVTVTGPAQHLQGAAVFAASVLIPMPGSWLAQVTLRAGGVSVWRGSFVFQAHASGWHSLPLSTQSGGSGQLCAAAPSHAISLSRTFRRPPLAEQVPLWQR